MLRPQLNSCVCYSICCASKTYLLFHPAVDPLYFATYRPNSICDGITLLLQVVLKDLRGMACMIGEAVAEGLRSLEPAHHDTKRGFRAANKALHLVLDLTNM